MIQGKNILLISPEPYGKVHLSKHHYAHELAKSNRVWFLNARGGKSGFTPIIELKRISENLTVIDYFNVFRGFGKFYLWDYFLTWVLSNMIRKMLPQLDLVWTFEQAKFFNLNWFKAAVLIFHPVDYIPGFEKYKLKIAQSAQFLLSVSPEILESINSTTPKFFVNHGVQFNQMSLQHNMPKSDAKSYQVGYIGNINIPYLAIDSLEKCIQKNPDVQFNFVGPYGKSNLGEVKTTNYLRLSKYSNCYFHGVVDRGELLSFVSSYDLFILCYDQKKYPIRVSNSHKLLEYLCTGKMVISNYFPLYEGKSKNMFKMINDLDQLGEELKKTLETIEDWNSEINQKARIGFAADHTYSKQLGKIEKIIYPTE